MTVEKLVGTRQEKFRKIAQLLYRKLTPVASLLRQEVRGVCPIVAGGGEL